MSWEPCVQIITHNPSLTPSYVDSTAKLPFTYYYRRPQASMILTPVEASHQPRTFAAGRVRQLADEHPRVWVIATLLFEVQTGVRPEPRCKPETQRGDSWGALERPVGI